MKTTVSKMKTTLVGLMACLTLHKTLVELEDITTSIILNKKQMHTSFLFFNEQREHQ